MSLQFWGGAVDKTSETTFTLTPHSWFAGTPAGSDLVEGFQLYYMSDNLKFTKIEIDGTSLCGPDSAITTTPTTTTVAACNVPPCNVAGISYFFSVILSSSFW